MTPRFSIIVPTRDRHESLSKCLASIAALDYPRDAYDVVVVDDGSRRNPGDVVARWSGSTCMSVVTIPHSGPAVARNAGVSRSRGDFLAFIDDDCTADVRWLITLRDRLVANPGAAVGGRVINALPANPYARASQELQAFLYTWYHVDRLGALRFFTTNNLCVARKVFNAVGGFDASFPFASEDRDWCDRCLLLGRELIYAPEAVVHHASDLTFRSFLRQHYRYGKGAARFHSARARRREDRIRLEPVNFYRAMLASPFMNRNPQPIRESLLLVASQAMSLAGFMRGLREMSFKIQ